MKEEIWIPIFNRDCHKDLCKILNVINSCKNNYHLKATENMIYNYHNIHNFNNITKYLIEKLHEKRKETEVN